MDNIKSVLTGVDLVAPRPAVLQIRTSHDVLNRLLALAERRGWSRSMAAHLCIALGLAVLRDYESKHGHQLELVK